MADTTQGAYGGRAELETSNDRKSSTSKSERSKETVEAPMSKMYGTPPVATPKPPEAIPDPTNAPVTPTVGDVLPKGEMDAVETAFTSSGGEFQDVNSIINKPNLTPAEKATLDKYNIETVTKAASNTKQTPEEKAATDASAVKAYTQLLKDAPERSSIWKNAAGGAAAGIPLGIVGSLFGGLAGAIYSAFKDDAAVAERTVAIKGMMDHGAPSDQINQALKDSGMTKEEFKSNVEKIKSTVASSQDGGASIPDSGKAFMGKVEGERDQQASTVSSVVPSTPTEAAAPADTGTWGGLSGIMNQLNQMRYERDVALANNSQKYANSLQQFKAQSGVPGEVSSLQAPVSKPQPVTMGPNSFTVGSVVNPTEAPAAPAPMTPTPETLTTLATTPGVDWNTAALLYNIPVEELKKMAGIVPVVQQQAPIQNFVPTTVATPEPKRMADKSLA